MNLARIHRGKETISRAGHDVAAAHGGGDEQPFARATSPPCGTPAR